MTTIRTVIAFFLLVSCSQAQEVMFVNAWNDSLPPFLANKTVSIADLGRKYPGWLSANRLTIYSYLNSTLYRSTNDGANWRALKTFPSGVSFVRELASGELLVGNYRTDDSVASVWISSGYQSYPTDCEWRKLLRSDTLSSAFTPWGVSVYGKYGLLVPYDETRGHAYWSEDTCKTWKNIFLLPQTTCANQAHMHGGTYDPWWDAIWLINGDGANRAIRVSMNHGETWTTVDSGASFTQMTTVYPMQDRILFGTDGAPDGIHVILRTPDRMLSEPKPAYTIGDGSFRHVSQQVFRAQGDGMPILFPFSSSNVESSLLIVSYDGINFSQVWKDPLSYDTKGLYTMVGPSLQDNYFGLMDDGRTTNYSTLSILSTKVIVDSVWAVVDYNPAYLNGGFEKWTKASDALQWREDIEGTSRVFQDSTQIHSGKCSARMDCDGAGDGVDITLSDIMTIGTAYTFSFWAKTSDPGKRWKVNDGVADFYTFSAPDTLWHEYHGTWTWTGDNFQIRRQDAANSSVWVDDVRVVASLLTGVDDLPRPTGRVPVNFVLFQNFPNPFNPTTTIRFAIPHACEVDLSVFTVLGQHVATLLSAFVPAGYHEVHFDASGLTSGVYFYRILAPDFSKTKSFVVIK